MGIVWWEAVGLSSARSPRWYIAPKIACFWFIMDVCMCCRLRCGVILCSAVVRGIVVPAQRPSLRARVWGLPQEFASALCAYSGRMLKFVSFSRCHWVPQCLRATRIAALLFVRWSSSVAGRRHRMRPSALFLSEQLCLGFHSAQAVCTPAQYCLTATWLFVQATVTVGLPGCARTCQLRLPLPSFSLY